MFFGKGANKIYNPYTTKDFYKFYMKEIGDNPLYEVSLKLYTELVGKFFKRIVSSILYANATFEIPYKFGLLRVRKKKVNVNALDKHGVDWDTTNKVGKVTYHLNEHSNNYKYSFEWNRETSRRKNIRFYALRMSRANKRLLAKLIKSGEYDYFETK